MKIYLAAPYSARDRLREIAVELSFDQHQITSRWLFENHEIQPATEGASWASSQEYIAKHTRQDLEDVTEADLLVVFTGQWIARFWPELANTSLHSGGRHVETGYALALSKPVVVMGICENVFQRGLGMNLSLYQELRSYLLGTLTCTSCGNDGAAEGHIHCIDCLEAARVA